MSGSGIAPQALALLGASAGVVVIILFRIMPRAAFAAWALVLFFVPVWIGFTAGFFWAAITLVTLVALVAGLRRVHWGIVDSIILIFAALCILLFGMKQASFSATEIALFEWIIPYVWGRLVLGRVGPDFVFRVIAACATVAAVLALIEFATGRNIFDSLPPLGPSYAIWAPLQYRGGLLRVEGAFGHSIALGASLAMSSAFVLASSVRTTLKLASLLLILAATVATFSRIGLISVVITVALSLLLGTRLTRAARVTIVIAAAALALIVIPFLSTVFLDAGNEAVGSAAYRANLFELVPHLAWFGSSTDLAVISADGSYLGAFADSVDNALLVIGLRFGIIPALIIVLLLIVATISVLIPRRANAGTIALVAQIPAMFSVAFITQYGMFVWFVGGLGVALWQMQSRRRDNALASPAFNSDLSAAELLSR
jgi:hypothetical protein